MINTHTRIQVLVEVSGSCYGDEWKIADIVKQSGSEALQLIQNRLNKDGLCIIGEPKVITVSSISDR